MNYDHSKGKAFVAAIDMHWDEAFASRVDRVAHENGITQEQFDVMVREYAWQVKVMFTPKQYDWRSRILIALHFLNPFSKGL